MKTFKSKEKSVSSHSLKFKYNNTKKKNVYIYVKNGDFT